MTEDEIKHEARLRAIEWLTCLTHAVLLKTISDSPLETLTQAKSDFLEGLRSKAFPHLDPAMSDALSAELETAAETLLTSVQRFLDRGRSPGMPF